MTRKEYREQLEAQQKQGVLTDAEFNKLSVSEKYNYARNQQMKGLPVTVEGDTYYDKGTKSKYKAQTVLSKKDEAVSGLISFASLAAKVDLISGWVHTGE
jgi:ribonuclease HII